MTREQMIDEAVRRLRTRSFAALKGRFIDGLTLDETCIQIEDKALRIVRTEFRRIANAQAL